MKKALEPTSKFENDYSNSSFFHSLKFSLLFLWLCLVLHEAQRAPVYAIAASERSLAGLPTRQPKQPTSAPPQPGNCV